MSPLLLAILLCSLYDICSSGVSEGFFRDLSVSHNFLQLFMISRYFSKPRENARSMREFSNILLLFIDSADSGELK